jgi:hypothetical protein
MASEYRMPEIPEDLLADLHRLRDAVFLAIDEVGRNDDLSRRGWNLIAEAYTHVFMTLERQAVNERPSFTCPDCGRTSYHPGDVAAQYCGNCHVFVDDRGEVT